MTVAVGLLSCNSNSSNMNTIYNYTALSNKGQEVNFADYKGSKENYIWASGWSTTGTPTEY